MGNTSSERAALERQAGHKTPRRDSSGGAKDGDRPKILMDSPEDADIFHSEEIKAPEKEEFLAWQHDLEANDKAPAQARPTVFRWTGGGKEVYLSGSFNNWSKLPLTRSQNNFVAILDLPEGEHQYKFFVDGQWTHDPSESCPARPQDPTTRSLTCLNQKRGSKPRPSSRHTCCRSS
ncbi:protein kinase, AMP-activated, beta 1 non-catalytic subunit, isoform CRA_a [Mus musculus]|uniref:5'-AMP-activated protein kinase subunit beta-1 n=1 Tax=Mus musculus TaxID=10090 RepID=S4R2R1_MOUSE|nr:protein kinase, AMP-activated, beta 1 non-catalytic subunit, isoform CRA_a [Mus musculus]EDL19837.1 protein kinase, AMP-activated, beta 1 non-catalytic subunit, isoform CRA_a [Mus musculus]